MAVEIEEYIPGVNEKPRTTIRSDKFKAEFTVRPTFDGFVFYEVGVSAGTLPEKLKGRWTRMKDAVKAVTDYERTAPKTAMKRREDTYEENKAKRLQREASESASTAD